MLARVGRLSVAVLVVALSLLVVPQRSWAQVEIFDVRACSVAFGDCTNVFTEVIRSLNHEARKPDARLEAQFVLQSESKENRGHGPWKEKEDRCGRGNKRCVPLEPPATVDPAVPPGTTVTPEPATLVLLGTGLLALSLYGLRSGGTAVS
ncbi:MAG: PEP-CTERM sorting domain-containing protein [Gemmatimonadaceae bacterium]